MAQPPPRSFYRGKVCVVSGANRGIGLALTRALLDAGASVVAGCRSPDNASELQALMESHASQLQLGKLDVADKSSVHAFADMAPKAIDVVFNSAGINVDDQDVAHVTVEQMVASFRTNTLGPMLMMQALGTNVRAAKGRFANISSVMGSIEENESGGNTAYRASKAALNMVNKNFALFDDEIIYLTMHPGWVKTAMGGSNAQIDASQSASGLLETVAQATAADSGSFLRYTNDVIPW